MKFSIPVSFMVDAEVEVDAVDRDEAAEMVAEGELPRKVDWVYREDSFEVHED